MPLRGRKLDDEAVVRWNKRGDALEAGSRLVTDKPDTDEWTLWPCLAASKRSTDDGDTVDLRLDR
jgi:hypothetical protein